MTISRDRRSGLAGRFLGSIGLAALLLLGPACIKHAPRYELPPPIAENQAEMAEGSLPVEVVDFTWTFVHGGSHIRLTGTARNVGAAPIQAVTMDAVLFDEYGAELSKGSFYLSPTYLPPGKEAHFEFVVMLVRNRNIQHIRLLTNARTLR